MHIPGINFLEGRMLIFPGLDKEIFRRENKAQLPFCMGKKIVLQIMFMLSVYRTSFAISVKHKKSCFANKRYHPAPSWTKQALHHAEGTGKGYLCFWPVQHWLCISAQWAKFQSGKWKVCLWDHTYILSPSRGACFAQAGCGATSIECMAGVHSHLLERLSSSHPPKPLSNHKTWHMETFAWKGSSWSALSCWWSHRQFRGPSLSIHLSQQRHSESWRTQWIPSFITYLAALSQPHCCNTDGIIAQI